LFLDYAHHAGAIDEAAFCELTDNFGIALKGLVLAQDDFQTAAEPTIVYFTLLKAALSTKQAHFAALAGGPPEQAELWGWQRKPGNLDSSWDAPGTCIGWIEGDDLYLESDAAFYVAQETGRAMGESVTVARKTLNKRLAENKLLIDWDKKLRTYKIRKVIGGSTHNVVHLSLSTFARSDD
jgi:hypothetical protein